MTNKPTDRQTGQASAVARREGDGRAWPTVTKLNGGSQKFGSRQKVPSGPVGGSGRKTNLSRSS